MVTGLFLGDRSFTAPVWAISAALGAALLALLVRGTTRLIGGPAARPAAIGAALVIVLVGILNLALDVSVEPATFTVIAVSTAAAVLLFTNRSAAPR